MRIIKKKKYVVDGIKICDISGWNLIFIIYLNIRWKKHEI